MTEKKKPKVLIADDEEHIRVYIKSIVQSLGTEVVAVARNGKEAVDLFRQHRPHLTLLDINMPIMDGLAALKEIREEDPKALVIMLTSLTSMDVVEKCLDAGAENYLRKDLKIAEIKEEIKQSWLHHFKQ